MRWTVLAYVGACATLMLLAGNIVQMRMLCNSMEDPLTHAQHSRPYHPLVFSSMASSTAPRLPMHLNRPLGALSSGTQLSRRPPPEHSIEDIRLTRRQTELMRRKWSRKDVAVAPKSNTSFIHGTRIPKLFHHTWKVPFEDLSDTIRTSVEHWRSINPDFAGHFYADEDVKAFVEVYFPEQLHIFESLSVIQRADLFRYLVLLRDGGVYNDVDVYPELGVNLWMKDAMSDVVYLSGSSSEKEADEPDERWEPKCLVGTENLFTTDAAAVSNGYCGKIQFTQWTIACAPGHPILKYVVDLIGEQVEQQLARAPFSSNDLIKPRFNTLKTTGPFIWTRAVEKYLGDHGVELDAVHRAQWTNQLTSVAVGDTLLLSPCKFGRNPFWPDRCGDAVKTFVRHQFMGSWKTKTPTITLIVLGIIAAVVIVVAFIAHRVLLSRGINAIDRLTAYAKYSNWMDAFSWRSSWKPKGRSRGRSRGSRMGAGHRKWTSRSTPKAHMHISASPVDEEESTPFRRGTRDEIMC